ncbi:unnamed protein product (macronuclear) [Paramecium tetraurelia]|uniref:EamA domain-containing protein n=1 Tax=Paramecium tetraurelia TaxID=5888 RepID=A0CXE4_PARTE|nr:uncharacterized protein GSPATT00011093001 [Paramecium tetraurelia]CAK75461.1 unnamed protein product [Paramecium tetraurelia]|eukprot:XP_001442858.1 hypothetical protein (macronuclear) [Paramecium tetraurelia strain d4-2]
MTSISSANGYILIVLQMLVNTASSIVFKLQSKIKIDNQEFNHPFTQTFTMFFGESICYIIFLLYKSFNYSKYLYELELANKLKQETKINYLVVIIPTLCDLIASCLAFFALSLMPTSVYQMLRGATVVITAIFQVIFLKKVPTKRQILGMSLVVLGNLIVGITIYLKSTQSDYLIGVLFLCLSFFMFSFQVILEEKYFRKYYLNPFELVGLEGLWGLVFTTILLSILEFIPCPSQMQSGQQTIQFFQVVFSFHDKNYQPQLFLLIIAEATSILLLNSICMAVVKYLSALTKSVVQVTTIALVWITCLIIGWEKFYWGQLIGFIILVFGSLIYNNIIKLPIKCLEQQQKVESQQSKSETEELLN